MSSRQPSKKTTLQLDLIRAEPKRPADVSTTANSGHQLRETINPANQRPAAQPQPPTPTRANSNDNLSQQTTIRSPSLEAGLAAPPSLDVELVGSRICQVIAPVTLCALYTCVIVRILSYDLMSHEPGLLDKTWNHLGVPTAREQSSITGDLVIVLGILMLIIAATLIVMLVFYLEWHCCLTYYFYLPSFIILALLTPLILRELLQALNWFAVDLITMLLFTWNFTCVGMMSIFSVGVRPPLCLQQYFLIHNSSVLVVVIMLTLPGWAPWLLLGFLVLWDLFAVLTPFGPLKLIIGMAEREGIVDMPGLIYSTDVPQATNVESPTADTALPAASNNPGVAGGTGNTAPNGKRLGKLETIQATESSIGKMSNEKSGLTVSKIETIESDALPRVSKIESVVKSIAPKSAADNRREQARQQQMQQLKSRLHERPFEVDGQSSLEERGVSIGLGDFIFYSLLVGLTARGRDQDNFYATLATLNAILVGLIVTLVILAVTRRALPALPISIGLGLYIAGLSYYFAPNFSNRLAEEAVFI